MSNGWQRRRNPPPLFEPVWIQRPGRLQFRDTLSTNLSWMLCVTLAEMLQISSAEQKTQKQHNQVLLSSFGVEYLTL